MNERINCINCIYWQEPFCKLLPKWENMYDHEAIMWLCGHFIDRETNKSYRDLYFEEKCKCKTKREQLYSSNMFFELKDKDDCPIHGEDK